VLIHRCVIYCHFYCTKGRKNVYVCMIYLFNKCVFIYLLRSGYKYILERKRKSRLQSICKVGFNMAAHAMPWPFILIAAFCSLFSHVQKQRSLIESPFQFGEKLAEWGKLNRGKKRIIRRLWNHNCLWLLSGLHRTGFSSLCELAFCWRVIDVNCGKN